MVVLVVVLHRGEVYCLVGQHTVGLIPASSEAGLLPMDVTFHLDSLIGKLTCRFVDRQGLTVSLLLQGIC